MHFNSLCLMSVHINRGDKIAILYNPGDWPYISMDENGKLNYKNGGLPQSGNLDLHLKKLEIDIVEFIPNRTFDGVAVIDFEMWRPTFRQNFDKLRIYRDLTISDVNKKHPTWTRDQIERQAQFIFENAAVNFFNRTLLRAQKLRPYAKWGFYGFPHCFNRFRDYSYLEKCPEQVERENDKLSFLFSNAIYPSLYTTQNQTGTTLVKFVQGKMREANRVATTKTVLKLAFIRYQYTDSMNFMSTVSSILYCAKSFNLI
jgi:hyaluronoglucosaminidase